MKFIKDKWYLLNNGGDLWYIKFSHLNEENTIYASYYIFSNQVKRGGNFGKVGYYEFVLCDYLDLQKIAHLIPAIYEIY